MKQLWLSYDLGNGLGSRFWRKSPFGWEDSGNFAKTGDIVWSSCTVNGILGCQHWLLGNSRPTFSSSFGKGLKIGYPIIPFHLMVLLVPIQTRRFCLPFWITQRNRWEVGGPGMSLMVAGFSDKLPVLLEARISQAFFWVGYIYIYI